MSANTPVNATLFDAASRGDLKGVQAALAQGASLTAKDGVGFTALTIAARDGRSEVVQYLLAQGAEVTNLAIRAASMSVESNEWILGLLQLAQLRQVKPDTSQRSPAEARLLHGAHQGDLAAVKEAIQAGADVNVADGHENSALRWAARWGHAEVVQALLDAGADVNQKSSTNWTALIEAVLAGHEEIVALLIERGADVNARTFAQASVLYFAEDVVQYAGDKERARRIAHLLKEKGATYSAPEEDED